MPSPKPLDREVMLQSFRQTYATVGRRPNRDEVTKYCIAKYGTYYKHFGGIDAVCDAAGLPDYQTELALQIRRLWLEIGHPPNTTDLINYRLEPESKVLVYSPGTYLKFYAHWKDILAAAAEVPTEFIFHDRAVS